MPRSDAETAPESGASPAAAGGRQRRLGVYRVSARWQARDAVAQGDARAVLTPWSPGGGVVALSKGAVGLLDLVVAALEQLGPEACDVWLCAWAIGTREGRRLAEVVRQGRIAHLQLLTDASLVRRCPAEAALLRELFGADAIRLSEVHAKLAVVRRADQARVVFSSANLNAPVRLEAFVVLDDPGVADYLVRSLTELHSRRALAWEASGQAHREHFDQWHQATPAAGAAATRRGPRRGNPAYLDDSPLGHDVRRPGVSFL